ncbi:YdhR family protein [Corynebacterium renale]|uniref:YdhR family protein n=1 Tax=Corynebacterium renale TaxID=1724 RepID=UPI000DFAF6FD|nr:YdhR family protein [Corynebacterium renale]STD70308.1 monooxygenase [Corynebacterium renale]
MATLLVFEFPSTGPFGAKAVDAYRELAEDIAGEPDLVWKVWTEDPARGVAGGVYLFCERGGGGWLRREAYEAARGLRD